MKHAFPQSLYWDHLHLGRLSQLQVSKKIAEKRNLRALETPSKASSTEVQLIDQLATIPLSLGIPAYNIQIPNARPKKAHLWTPFQP